MWIETYRKCVLVVCWDKGGTSVARKNRKDRGNRGRNMCVFIARGCIFVRFNNVKGWKNRKKINWL